MQGRTRLVRVIRALEYSGALEYRLQPVGGSARLKAVLQRCAGVPASAGCGM